MVLRSLSGAPPQPETVSGNIAPGGGNPKENNATEIEGNTVKGLTTCATNNPAPINDGHKNTFTGAPTVGPPASPALPTSRQASSWSQFCSVDNSRNAPDTTAW